MVAAAQLCAGDLYINTTDDFLDFVSAVSSWKNRYSGKTVFLNADIDMGDRSSEFEPIENFQGDFNGQGYGIKNLQVNSNGNEAGLFSDLDGGHISNFYIDSSCNFSAVGSWPMYVGSVVAMLTRQANLCVYPGL